MKAKIYTKTGDQGKTALIGGHRVLKTDARLNAYGTIDELNSSLGLAVALLREDHRNDDLASKLELIQNQLFNLGSQLACESDDMRKQLPNILPSHVEELERDMDNWEPLLPELTQFILPGGTLAGAQLHVARTICRRAERLTVALAETTHVDGLLVVYLNRLSDFLFLAARLVNHRLKVTETVWRK